MMEHENENECTSTSTDDVEMMNSKSIAPSGNDITNSINDNDDRDSEVTSMNMKNGDSEEKIVVASDNEVNNDIISSSSPTNDIDDDNRVVNSPEPEDLTIDEGDSAVMHDDADANNEDNNEDVDMYSDICPAPVVIEKTETDEKESEQIDPLPLEKIADDESPSSPPLEKSEEDSPTSPPVDTTQDNPSSPPSHASPLQDGPLSPPAAADESQDGPSSPDEQVVRPSSAEIASPSPKPLNEDSSISSDFQKHEESILSQEDIISENNDDDDDDGNGDNKGSQSPDVSNLMIGTPISLEESQSQPSPPVLTVKKKAEKVLVVKKTDDDEEIEEGEDLEDGEIMDEEEEEQMEVDEVKQVAAVVVPPQRSSKKESSKSSSKSKDKSSDKKKREKEKENVDELDPVKRLLAEVREKDNREREEREKRRKEKKRSHKDDKEKPPKEKEVNTKKKKRRMTEEEEEGEEFLFVRGASPSAGPVGGSGDTENWDQIDDRRGGKRRRESDDGASPGHRHRYVLNCNFNIKYLTLFRHVVLKHIYLSLYRRGGHEGSNSPTRANRIPDRPTSKRQERREPKSDVICAYFMQGKCQKSAEQCNFSHAAIPPRKMELCKFWMMECCAKKEKCLYLHNDFPCKYFHTGLVCRQADKCKFSHNPLSDVTKQVLLKVSIVIFLFRR